MRLIFSKRKMSIFPKNGFSSFSKWHVTIKMGLKQDFSVFVIFRFSKNADKNLTEGLRAGITWLRSFWITLFTRFEMVVEHGWKSTRFTACHISAIWGSKHHRAKMVLLDVKTEILYGFICVFLIILTAWITAEIYQRSRSTLRSSKDFKVLKVHLGMASWETFLAQTFMMFKLISTCFLIAILRFFFQFKEK